ncbi:hypothetical protein DQ04_04371030 [Trypanosoma grayi]|uniref:hypothetical protein n=1 Tax=Trypanosoma grayi TaxID=71804 RepID=UPI0004F4A682|nr:hypothetical protein DQ04_04371030 [Trypanosoma grayi]KEG09967.1 hypothetical protein DQ04_04371030 [Trypanosoma grayi]
MMTRLFWPIVALACMMAMTTAVANEAAEHLTDSSYSIIFSREPAPQLLDKERYYPMQLSNGSAYVCVLPEEQRKREETGKRFEVNSRLPAHVVSSLHHIFRDWCFNTVDGWWTYMFCWNNKVEQFHAPPLVLRDGKLLAESSRAQSYFLLGAAPPIDTMDFRYGMAPSGERYIYTKYRNGDVCDLTQTPRMTEVRMYCAPEGEKSSLRVHESEVCRYVARVKSRRACIPELQRQVTRSVITCHELSYTQK